MLQLFILTIVFCTFISCEKTDDLLNVHIIPHSHCDPGWLFTEDEYFNITVKLILDRVVARLKKNNNETFHWVETVYLKQWWDQASSIQKKDFLYLVHKTQQMEIMMGGWVMTDQACVTYSSVILEMTEGHEFLKNEISVKPRNGWSIDPFGHSSGLPYFYKKMGFDYHVIGRASNEIKKKWRKEKKMEFFWKHEKRSEEEEETDKMLFTKMMYNSYCPGAPFSWEGNYPDSEYNPKSSPPITDKNIEKTSWLLYYDLKNRSAAVKSNKHVFFPFGCDFQYREPSRLFGNMTLLINYMNKRKDVFKMNLQFSKVSTYINSILEEKFDYPEYEGDFFVYNDCDVCYWSGYFVSNPFLTRNPIIKIASRIGEHWLRDVETLNVLQSIEQSISSKQKRKEFQDAITVLRQKVAIINHHDAITGTEKVYVESNYIKELDEAISVLKPFIEDSISSLLSPIYYKKNSIPFVITDNLFLEPLKLKEIENLGLVFFNNLGWIRKGYFVSHLIDKTIKGLKIIDNLNKTVEYSIIPSFFSPDHNELILPVNHVSPLGYIVYNVEETEFHDGNDYLEVESENPPANDPVTISNQIYEISFDGDTQKMVSIKNKRDDVDVKLSFDFYYYIPETANDTQDSGAYIFRAKSNESYQIIDKAKTVNVHDTPLFAEINQEYENYIKVIFRLYKKNDSKIEILYKIGEIPMDREIIIKITTDIENEKKVFIDELGFEPREKVYNSQIPLEGNFFPFVYKTFMEDEYNKLSLITDKSQSVGISNIEGEIFVMIDRRISVDDRRGRGDPLNDTTIFTFRNYLFFESLKSKSDVDQKIYDLNFPMKSFIVNNTRLIERHVLDVFHPLEDEVHLLSLNNINSQNVLRFSNIYRNTTSKVNVRNFFKDYIIENLRETSLSLLNDNKGIDSDKDIKFLPFSVKSYKITIRKGINYLLLYIFIGVFSCILCTCGCCMIFILYYYLYNSFKHDKKGYMEIQ